MIRQYKLMHKQIHVLDCLYDDELNGFTKIVNVLHPEHVPIGTHMVAGIPNKTDINKWWGNRSIPNSRWNEKINDQLGIQSSKELLTKSMGLSLTDQYWICPQDAIMRWDEINYFENVFDTKIGDILIGDSKESITNFPEDQYRSPASSAVGNLKKTWEIICDKRCMVKGGTIPFFQEIYNEKFISEVYDLISKIDYVQYSIIMRNQKPYNVCENFVTKDTEFIPAIDIINSAKRKNDISNLEHFILVCENNGLQKVRTVIEEMFAIDYIVGNKDRHFSNFGIIRNAETLKWESLAPVFDNGNSLWYDTSTRRINIKEDISGCNSAYDSQEVILSKMKHLPEFDHEILMQLPIKLKEIFSQSADIDKERIDIISNGLLYRIEKYKQFSNHKNISKNETNMEVKKALLQRQKQKDKPKDKTKKNKEMEL